MQKYLLLTGATGLVGQYLVRDLLLAGHRLALVVRSSRQESVYERVESLLQKWEMDLAVKLPRPVVFEGDVAEPGLGLDEAARSWISAYCNRVLHNAAVLTFVGADRSGEPWRTNLDGTRHVLELCHELGLTELHYVSTAYVCGERTGVIREDELACGQSFRNDYEHAKYLAEKLVREAKFIKQLAVYRPAVIAGDSVTGYTSTYHGLYMYLQMISVINRYTDPDPDGRRHTPVRLTMTGDEPRNVVPVDWVSQAICQLVSNPAAIGKTFHLAPKKRVTPRDILSAGFKFFNSYGAEFVGPSVAAVDDSATSTERAIQESKTIYEAYETSDPVFDTTNLDLLAPDLPCPEIDEAMLCRFWSFAEADKWGRRRKTPLGVESWGGDLLASVPPDELGRRISAEVGDVSSNHGIGLAVSGPGGGEWKLIPQANGDWEVEAGLPADTRSLVIQMTMDDLKRLTATGECFEATLAADGEDANSISG